MTSPLLVLRLSCAGSAVHGKKWKTLVELANAIFEDIEIFYNHQGRHSCIGYRTSIEHELRSETTTDTA